MKFLTWPLLVVKKCKKVHSQIITWWLGGEKSISCCLSVVKDFPHNSLSALKFQGVHAEHDNRAEAGTKRQAAWAGDKNCTV